MYMIDSRWVVHVVSPFAGGDYSLCGESFEITSRCDGPATCADCKETASRLREVIRKTKYVRKSKLVSLKGTAD